MGLLSLVFLDENCSAGKVMDPMSAALCVTDAGVMFGDGVFETILAVDGVLQQEEQHFVRLLSSANILGLVKPNLGVWRNVVATAFGEAGRVRGGLQGQLVVKLCYTRGVAGVSDFTGWVCVSEVSQKVLEQRKTGVRAITLVRDVVANLEASWLLYGAKTLSYATNIAAMRYAEKNNAEDAIFVNTDGYVLEGATSNVVIVKGKTLFSPPASAGILVGTTQLALFKKAKLENWNVVYKNFTVQDIYEADATFLTSSIRLVVPVFCLNEVMLKTLLLF